jgi:hypothetical protein
VAASKTFDYLTRKKTADIEEVMRYVLHEINADGKVKAAAIAAANFTYKHKTKNFLLTQKEIMQQLTNASDRIISEIEASVGIEA